MKFTRRELGFAAWGCILALAACADAPSEPTAEYVVISPPRPTGASDKIEIIEFYWFGCPHCADMHPRLQAWLAHKPADAELVYRPAVLRDGWEAAARLHYALDSMAELDRLSGAVFDAVQINDLKIGDEAMLFDWVGRQGVDRERFIAAYRSPEVQAAARQAHSFGPDYGLRGVPTFVVAGKYLTSNGLTGSAQATLEVLDRLIKQARDERHAAR